MSICGLDFGTSNSTVGVVHQQQPLMVPLELNSQSGDFETTLPSALFFDFETDEIHFGREAIELYSRGEFGRLMRSMKSILGSKNMDEGTQIKHKRYAFNDIIGFFMASLKQRAEAFNQQSLESVVLGRPVHFNDHHPELDLAAQNRMADIAHSVGFKQVSFQYEPIAAAYDYEQQVDKEELALIIDIGGGTSDFTLIKLSKQNRLKAQRDDDLLANHGIHIGGTDFDRHLSMATVMPHFGLNSYYIDKPTLKMPRHYYVDLATWHRIHLLYDANVLRDIAELARESQDKQAMLRLAQLLKNKQGHKLAASVEQAKIDLSHQETTNIDLSYLVNLKGHDNSEELLLNKASQLDLANAIEADVNKVFAAIDDTLTQAGLQASQIDTLFTTGGSTALPSVKKLISEKFSQAKWISGDLFNSVGKGLLLDAQRRYL
ncbi:Hsp70 family protein [Reinekea forsetii]|nr:Hsp70 family protein [Reinekea forsetii]